MYTNRILQEIKLHMMLYLVRRTGSVVVLVVAAAAAPGTNMTSLQ
jgi:hypothetical protein